MKTTKVTASGAIHGAGFSHASGTINKEAQKKADAYYRAYLKRVS